MHAGVAGNAHVILLPEIPYDIDRVVERIKQRYAAGRRYCIVVVAEGARAQGRRHQHHRRRSSAARSGWAASPRRSAPTWASATGFETRSLVLGHLQRGGSPTHRDRLLALRFGAAAVRMVEQGKFGHIVAYRSPAHGAGADGGGDRDHEDGPARLRHRPDRPRPRHLPRRLSPSPRRFAGEAGSDYRCCGHHPYHEPAAGAGPGHREPRPVAGPGRRGKFPHREADRRGRDGQRLQGAAAVAEQAGGGQGPAPSPAQGRQARRPVQARGEERVAAQSPELDPDHRLRRGQRRHALHRDGAADRARSRPRDPRRLPAAAAARRARS